MDLHDFWQENKRWILGIALGFLVYLIAGSVIEDKYSNAGLSRAANKARIALGRDEGYFTQAQNSEARDVRENLAAVRGQLDKALVFEPTGDFNLAGKGDAHNHFDQVSRRVKHDLLDRADALGVDAQSKSLDWDAPEGREQIVTTLVGLCLLEEAVTRLLDAHEAVRERDFRAPGLTSIESFKIQSGTRRSTTNRSSSSSGEDPITEEKVRFKLHADEATIKQFLEACLKQRPRIVLANDFKMGPGRDAEDPLIVTGTLSAIQLRATP